MGKLVDTRKVVDNAGIGYVMSFVLILSCDYPEVQYDFQDPATPAMYGVIDLHNDVAAFLLLIVALVIWVLTANVFLHSAQFSTVRITYTWVRDILAYLLKAVWRGPVNAEFVHNEEWHAICSRRARIVAHHDSLEIVWTALPALIMLCIALPSFALLYSMDEIVGAALTIKTVGHQWYWHYEYSLCDSLEEPVGISNELDNGDISDVKPIKWAPRSPVGKRTAEDAYNKFKWFIERDLVRINPPVVVSAAGWLDEWFVGFEEYTYTRDFGLLEERDWGIQVSRDIPGPNALSMSELRAYQDKIYSMFEVFQEHGVEQSEVLEYIGGKLSIREMADAMLADRSAWQKLDAVVSELAGNIESSRAPYVDWVSNHNNSLKFDSYMLDAADAPRHLRLLAVDRPVYLPVRTHVRLLVTAADVLHSWAVPSLGIKVDACPGRVNQISFYIRRFGDFYGQCSEICGINHGFMPIHIKVVDGHDFCNFIQDGCTKREYLAFSAEQGQDSDGDSKGLSTKQKVVLGILVIVGTLLLGYGVWRYFRGGGNGGGGGSPPGSPDGGGGSGSPLPPRSVDLEYSCDSSTPGRTTTPVDYPPTPVRDAPTPVRDMASTTSPSSRPDVGSGSSTSTSFTSSSSSSGHSSGFESAASSSSSPSSSTMVGSISDSATSAAAPSSSPTCSGSVCETISKTLESVTSSIPESATEMVDAVSSAASASPAAAAGAAAVTMAAQAVARVLSDPSTAQAAAEGIRQATQAGAPPIVSVVMPEAVRTIDIWLAGFANFNTDISQAFLEYRNNPAFRLPLGSVWYNLHMRLNELFIRGTLILEEVGAVPADDPNRALMDFMNRRMRAAAEYRRWLLGALRECGWLRV